MIFRWNNALREALYRVFEYVVCSRLWCCVCVVGALWRAIKNLKYVYGLFDIKAYLCYLCHK